MAAAMNGISVHGGFLPYGGTFLVFSDYCKNSIRLSSMMKQQVIYVFTHDSIGLGEDGPTHQPIEHLASLKVQYPIFVLFVLVILLKHLKHGNLLLTKKFSYSINSLKTKPSNYKKRLQK